MRPARLPLVLLAGCSLSRLDPLPCADNQTCRDAFGWGYTCDTDAGLCQQAAVEDRCATTWPEDLLTDRDSYADTIIFGGLIDRSAADAEMKAFELPIRQVNEKSGLDGRDYGLIECDVQESSSYDSRTLDEANIDMATWLADSIGVPAVLGPQYSSTAIDVYSAIAPFGTMIMSHSATSPALTDIDGGDPSANDPGLFWRTAPPDSLQGKVIAGDMIDRGISKVAVIFQDGAYGEGLEDAFNTAFLAAGGTTDLYPFSADTDRDEAVVEVASSDDEEVLFIASDVETVEAFLRGAASLGDGYEGKGIFLTDGAYYESVFTDTQDSASALFDQIRGSRPTVDTDSTTYQLFKASFQSAYDLDPDAYAYTAYAYDASWLLIYGTAWATYQLDGVSGVNMARGMLKVSSGDEVEIKPNSWTTVTADFAAGHAVDVVGASGNLDYDEVGEASAPIEIWTVSCSGSSCSFTRESVVEP